MTLIIIILNLFVFNKVIAATVNCSGGECEFNNSYHYKYAKTYCPQTLIYEDVKTDYTNFIVTKNGKKCEVFETSN